MAQKRKISVRKILQVFLTFVATTGCVIAMVSASSIEENKTVKSVAVHIRNDKKYHFIEEKEILNLAIYNRHVNLAATPMSKLDIKGMERVIKADPWVASAQVFVDNDNVLQLYITQRIPVARLFQQDGTSYYLDTTLSIMPLSRSYIYYTTVVTNVPELKNDSASWAMRKEIITLVRTIQADSFWNAQVSQVVVDSSGMFELVPMLGDHRILFGNTIGMKEKFSKLFAFYKNVLNRIGWDRYEVLDLRFNGQIVASPSLPYKGPADKAIASMNWINSIVETEARNDSMHTLDASNSHAAAAQDKPKQPIKPITVQLKPANKPAAKPVVNAAAKKDAKKPEAKKDVKKKPEAKKADTRKADNKKADPKKEEKKKSGPKKDIKPQAKDAKKPEAKTADKSKDKSTDKQKKQTKPKYEYKDKKDHH